MKEQYTEAFFNKTQNTPADCKENDDTADMDTQRFETTPEDSFQLYLQEIKDIPLLTAEEEVALAKRVAEGDVAAKEAIIKANLRLVVSVARKYYKKSGMPIQDIVAEGNIGLIRAIEKFSLEKECRFSTYATRWIKQSISRSIADKSRMIRVPVHVHELIKLAARWAATEEAFRIMIVAEGKSKMKRISIVDDLRGFVSADIRNTNKNLDYLCYSKEIGE